MWLVKVDATDVGEERDDQMKRRSKATTDINENIYIIETSGTRVKEVMNDESTMVGASNKDR